MAVLALDRAVQRVARPSQTFRETQSVLGVSAQDPGAYSRGPGVTAEDLGGSSQDPGGYSQVLWEHADVPWAVTGTACFCPETGQPSRSGACFRGPAAGCLLLLLRPLRCLLLPALTRGARGGPPSMTRRAVRGRAGPDGELAAPLGSRRHKPAAPGSGAYVRRPGAARGSPGMAWLSTADRWNSGGLRCL